MSAVGPGGASRPGWCGVRENPEWLWVEEDSGRQRRDEDGEVEKGQAEDGDVRGHLRPTP
jgi:hypothetical protein